MHLSTDLNQTSLLIFIKDKFRSPDGFYYHELQLVIFVSVVRPTIVQNRISIIDLNYQWIHSLFFFLRLVNQEFVTWVFNDLIINLIMVVNEMNERANGNLDIDFNWMF